MTDIRIHIGVSALCHQLKAPARLCEHIAGHRKAFAAVDGTAAVIIAVEIGSER